MNIPGLSTSGLLMLHGAIANALAVDDAIPAGQDKPFGVRTFPDWRAMADEIEAVLNQRNAPYIRILW